MKDKKIELSGKLKSGPINYNSFICFSLPYEDPKFDKIKWAAILYYGQDKQTLLSLEENDIVKISGVVKYKKYSNNQVYAIEIIADSIKVVFQNFIEKTSEKIKPIDDSPIFD